MLGRSYLSLLCFSFACFLLPSSLYAQGFFSESGVSKPLVSLVVKGEDREHLESALLKLRDLHKTLGIAVSEVVIVGRIPPLRGRRRPSRDAIGGRSLEGGGSYPGSYDELLSMLKQGNLGALEAMQEVRLEPEFEQKLQRMSDAAAKRVASGLDASEVEKVIFAKLRPELKAYVKMLEGLSDDQLRAIEKHHFEALRKRTVNSRSTPLLQRLMLELDLVALEERSPVKVLAKYSARKSPLWVVRSGGVDYVFEGVQDPTTFFDERGAFRRAASKTELAAALAGDGFVRGVSYEGRVFASSEAELATKKALSYRPDLSSAFSKGADDLSYRLRELPHCPEPGLRRVEVFSKSRARSLMDMIFYSPDSVPQNAAALRYSGRARLVSYRSGSFSAGAQMGAGSWAERLDVRCLPTRFHFVTVNDKHFMEYREGERAWD